MFENLFFLVKGEYILEDQKHIGYGIGCYMDRKEMIFEDLSENCRTVSNFVEKCNMLHLSPTHLRDAVDDFLLECEEILIYRNEQKQIK